MIRIAPSILSADFAKLGEEISSVQTAGADWIHVDVMDGHFVPNLTIGPQVVAAIRNVTDLPLDVHLMIANPDAYIDLFSEAGSDVITVHQEVCTHLHRTVSRIKEKGKKAGVAINPATPLHAIESMMADIDLLLIMSVNPGFGGQSFIRSTLTKIEQAARWKAERYPNVHIEVDGGVNSDTAPAVIAAGADVLVAGHAIFRAENRSQAIRTLRG